MSTFVHKNGGMTIRSGTEDAPDTELGRHMDDSRNDLGLTWDDVATLSGLSRQTLFDIRKGHTDYRRMRSSTKRKIEVALHWDRGSVDAIIKEGKGPTATSASAPPPRPVRWTPEKERLFRELEATFATYGLELNEENWRLVEEQYELKTRHRKEPTGDNSA